MFPRRRPGSRSSACELGPISVEPTIPQTIPETHQIEHALGFTDIYGSLTPRQISIISLYPPSRTGTCILTQVCSYWICNWNGLDGRYWKSIVYVRLVHYTERIPSVLKFADSDTGAAYVIPKKLMSEDIDSS